MGKSKDIQCRKCWGYGHIERGCPNQRGMIVREDGGYDSASDYDDETLVLNTSREEDDAEQDI